MKQKCPICDAEVKPNARYPKYACAPCVKRATSLDGKPVEFLQQGNQGLFAARHVDTGDEYHDHDCLIDGTECRADVARFGGIAVEAY